ERDSAHVGGGVDLDDRDVGFAVGPDDTAAEFLLVGEPHRDRVGATDHVEVGQHVSALVDDDARAQTRRLKFLAPAGSTAAKELVEEVLEKRIVALGAGKDRGPRAPCSVPRWPTAGRTRSATLTNAACRASAVAIGGGGVARAGAGGLVRTA